MSRVRCRIVLAVGRYERAVTQTSVRSVLRWVLSDSLCDLEFVKPDEDVAVECEAVVLLESCFRYWGHDEAVGDTIVTDLVQHLRPEYDSQVEVEVTYEPEDPFGDSCDHVWDDAGDLGKFGRIRRVWH